jgi:hypothetical protein
METGRNKLILITLFNVCVGREQQNVFAACAIVLLINVEIVRASCQRKIPFVVVDRASLLKHERIERHNVATL